MEDKKKRGKKKLLWLLLLLLLLSIAGGIFYYVQQSRKSPLARDEDALGGMLPGKTPTEIQQLLDEKVAEGMVNLSVMAEPVFEQGGKKGRLGLENAQGNNYSFQVDLVLDETQEVLYSSGLIDPGFYVEYVALNKTFEAGKYPASAVFTTYSLEETDEAIATTKVAVNLVIKEGTVYE